MATSENLKLVKDQLDFLVERLSTNTLGADERALLLGRMRALLVEMDTLAASALLEQKQYISNLRL